MPEGVDIGTALQNHFLPFLHCEPELPYKERANITILKRRLVSPDAPTLAQQQVAPPLQSHSTGPVEFGLPNEIESFCVHENLDRKHVIIAIQLAKTAFVCGESICLHLESDPDIDERWIVIDVMTKGSTDTVLAAEDAYVRELVKTVPWPDRRKIRLLYTIA